MREIKFRAWDARQKKMTYPFDINEYARDCDSEGLGEFPFIGEYLGETFGILMQYVDLKDKKGNEICEGDIVTVPLDAVGVVVFKQVPGDNQPLFFVENEKQDWCSTIDRVIEVIGNIYENPELLEEKK